MRKSIRSSVKNGVYGSTVLPTYLTSNKGKDALQHFLKTCEGNKDLEKIQVGNNESRFPASFATTKKRQCGSRLGDAGSHEVSTLNTMFLLLVSEGGENEGESRAESSKEEREKNAGKNEDSKNGWKTAAQRKHTDTYSTRIGFFFLQRTYF